MFEDVQELKDRPASPVSRKKRRAGSQASRQRSGKLRKQKEKEEKERRKREAGPSWIQTQESIR
jgi:cell division protein FtsA